MKNISLIESHVKNMYIVVKFNLQINYVLIFHILNKFLHNYRSLNVILLEFQMGQQKPNEVSVELLQEFLECIAESNAEQIKNRDILNVNNFTLFLNLIT